MKNLLKLITLSLFFTSNLAAEVLYYRPYGQATTITFGLHNENGTALEPASIFATGDCKIMIDEAVEANCTNLPTDEGQTFSLAITAAQATGKRIQIILVDLTSPQLWLDKVMIIETTGSTNAQHTGAIQRLYP